jgi:hypothetical protein
MFIVLANSLLFPVNSPKDVLEHFCELDANGAQIDEGRRSELAGLFTQSAASAPEDAIVIKDFVILGSTKVAGEIDFEVEYIYLGRLNVATARYSRLPATYPPGPVKVRVHYQLVPNMGGPKNNLKSEGSAHPEPAEWRIKGTPPIPHITVQAALQYVTRLRNNSSSATIKNNGAHAIVALNRLQ